MTLTIRVYKLETSPIVTVWRGFSSAVNLSIRLPILPDIPHGITYSLFSVVTRLSVNTNLLDPL